MTKLKKFCVYTPLRVLLISLILSSILAVIYLKRIEGTRDGLAGLYPYVMMAVTIVCCLLSYTVLLNLIEKVRNSFFLSFLTFYFPVLLFSVILLITFIGDYRVMIFLWLFPFLPFILPQTYYFIRFRQKLKSDIFVEDSLTPINEND
ncbi:MAG: hypothetical protein LBV43_14265 [Prevotella sp.]|jgi:hypothetical protein|nr:hypothetical protein [Prevotella sp.]